MNSFSEKLKQLRKDEKLTIVELSKRIGYSKSIISYWENGIKEPTLSAIKTIANYFGVTISELVESDYDIRDSSKLTREEWKLIEDYRGLGRPLKDVLQDLIKTWQSDSIKKTQKI